MQADRVPFTSRAVRATRGSSSLRVTIPQVVASMLGLRPGDRVVWIIDPYSGEVRVAKHTEHPTGGRAAAVLAVPAPLA